MRLIIFCLGLFSFFSSLFSVQSLVFDSGSQLIPYHQTLLKVSSDNRLLLYEKDLDFIKELSLPYQAGDTLITAFDTVFTVNQAHELSVYSSFRSSLSVTSLYKDVRAFDVTQDSLVYLNSDGEVVSVDYRNGHDFWRKKQACSEIKLLPGSEQILCVSNKSLLVLNPENGEMLFKKELSNKIESIVSIWSRGLVFHDTELGYQSLMFQGNVLTELKVPNKEVIASVRQKELLLKSDDAKGYSSFDVETGQSRWTHLFDVAPVLVAFNDEMLLFRQNADLVIWDHYTGKERFRFDPKRADNPSLFYEYDGTWYFAYPNTMLYIGEYEKEHSSH
jgi:hypothetical protein